MEFGGQQEQLTGTVDTASQLLLLDVDQLLSILHSCVSLANHMRRFSQFGSPPQIAQMLLNRFSSEDRSFFRGKQKERRVI